MKKRALCIIAILAACRHDYASEGDTPYVPAPTSTTPPAATSDGGAPPADAGPAPVFDSYCSTVSPAPVFCSDFDDGSLPGPWTRVDANGAGTLTLVTDKSVLATQANVSPPYAALSHVTDDPGAQSGALVRLGLPAPKKLLSIDFDYEVESQPSVGHSTFDAMVVKIGTHVLRFRLAPPKAQGAFIYEAADGGTQTTGGADGVGAFLHVSLQLDVEEGGLQVVEYGQLRFNLPKTAIETGPVDLYVGDDAFHGSDGSWSVRFDNVLVKSE